VAATAAAVPAGASTASTASAASAASDGSTGPAAAPHSRQMIRVTAPGYGTWHATLRAFAWRGGRWRYFGGPWPARLGYNGLAPRGAKREGDGRTPSGTFPLTFAFGVDRDPGTRLRWRHAARWDVWDDDPSSRRYNLWTDRRRHDPGRDPEPLHVRPAYRDAIVIGYNLSRIPGRGSAIFLHVNHTGATSGCVSIARPHVVRLLRWLRPAEHPTIRIGVSR